MPFQKNEAKVEEMDDETELDMFPEYVCKICDDDLGLLCDECDKNPNTECNTHWPVRATCGTCGERMVFDEAYFSQEEIEEVMGVSEGADASGYTYTDYDDLICDECNDWKGRCLCSEPEPLEPACRCVPERILYCKDCFVERTKKDDAWEYVENYDPKTKKLAEPVVIADCTCVPEPGFNCMKCHVKRTKNTDPWEWQASYPNGKYTYAGPTTTTTWVQKCRHYHVIVELPDGHKIRCSSMDEHKKEEDTPDFGLYADSGWVRKAQCRNEHINFPDYQIPENPELAVEQILDAWDRIKAGEDVEIGCIGGHGRTGTLLACFAVLAGKNPEDARNFVWDEYCKEAIESPKQEWWVEWFDAYIRGVEAPPMPVPPPPKVYTSTNYSTGGTVINPVKIIRPPMMACGKYNSQPVLGTQGVPCMFEANHPADEHSWVYAEAQGVKTLGQKPGAKVYCGETTQNASLGETQFPCEFWADHIAGKHSWVWLDDHSNLTLGDDVAGGRARLLDGVKPATDPVLCDRKNGNVHDGLIDSPCSFEPNHSGRHSWGYIKVGTENMTLGELRRREDAVALAAEEARGSAIALPPPSGNPAPGGPFQISEEHEAFARLMSWM